MSYDVTGQSDFYEQVRALKNGGDITLGLSKAARSSNVALCGFLLIFGCLSALYWLERSLVHEQLAHLVGPAGLPDSVMILDFVFGVGAVGVFMIPIAVHALRHPAEITINKSAVIFKSGWRIQDMCWDHVIEITRYPAGVEPADSIHEVEKIAVRGKHGSIIVESKYELSADRLLGLLNACWVACADKKSLPEYAELKTRIAKNSPEARAFDAMISSLRSRRRENEVAASSTQTYLVVLCFGITVAAGVVAWFGFQMIGRIK